MANGLFSIHVGVNNPLFSRDSLIELKYAKVTAKAFQEKFRNLQFDARILTNSDANTFDYKRELDSIKKAIGEEPALVVITFSGHGLLHPTKLEAEKGYKEEWAFYEKPLLDTTFWEQINGFSETTTVVVIADSCYSAGMWPSVAIKNANPHIILMAASGELDSLNTNNDKLKANPFAYFLMASLDNPTRFKNYFELFNEVKENMAAAGYTFPQPMIMTESNLNPAFFSQKPFEIPTVAIANRRTVIAPPQPVPVNQLSDQDIADYFKKLNDENVKYGRTTGDKVHSDRVKDSVALMGGITLQFADGTTMKNFNRGLMLTKSQLEHLMQAPDFQGLMICMGFHKYDPPQPFEITINGKTISEKLDGILFPIVERVVSGGLEGTKFVPPLPNCFDFSGGGGGTPTCPPLKPC